MGFMRSFAAYCRLRLCALVNRRAELSEMELWRMNSSLLRDAFPEQVEDPARWGDGVSVKMMKQLAESGLDRLWLGLDSWNGARRHPEVLEKARELDYLIGPYDSYLTAYFQQGVFQTHDLFSYKGSGDILNLVWGGQYGI